MTTYNKIISDAASQRFTVAAYTTGRKGGMAIVKECPKCKGTAMQFKSPYGSTLLACICGHREWMIKSPFENKAHRLFADWVFKTYATGTSWILCPICRQHKAKYWNGEMYVVKQFCGCGVTHTKARAGDKPILPAPRPDRGAEAKARSAKDAERLRVFKSECYKLGVCWKCGGIRTIGKGRRTLCDECAG